MLAKLAVHSSVALLPVGPGKPPNPKPNAEDPFVLPPSPYLGVDKSANSVHEDPSQNSVSVFPSGSYPAKIIPNVAVPEDDPCCLPVFISVVSVQELPSYCSTMVLFGSPPATTPSELDVPKPKA